MPGGGRQAGAGVLIERVVVLLLESLSGVGGGRADGLRQLPVVDGAAVPRDGGLRWEGVAGLRHLPLKPGRKGTQRHRGVAAGTMGAPVATADGSASGTPIWDGGITQ